MRRDPWTVDEWQEVNKWAAGRHNLAVPPSTPSIRSIVEAATHRSTDVVGALRDLTTVALSQPSLLPDWD